MTQVARLPVSRLSTLNNPGFTRLWPFSAPASLGHAVLSRGVEEQASFASLGARQTLRACKAYRLVVGCELVAADEALHHRDLRLDPGLPVGRAFQLADADLAVRPLTDDLTAAGLLDRFIELWVDLGTGAGTPARP